MNCSSSHWKGMRQDDASVPTVISDQLSAHYNDYGASNTNATINSFHNN